MIGGNIRAHPPDASAAEIVETFLDLPAAGARFERIFSEGQASPEGFWYDQETDEFVMLLSGGATVEAADPPEEVRLGPGDWLHIPARRRHRVRETEKGTLWLAVHFDGSKCRAAPERNFPDGVPLSPSPPEGVRGQG